MQIRATIEELYAVESKAALVDGEVVHMARSGEGAGVASLRIASRLFDYSAQTGQSRACGDGAGFHGSLPHRESCRPEAAYHPGPRNREALA